MPAIRRALPETRIVLQMDSEWLVEIPRGDGLARLRQVDRVLGVSRHIADQIRERYPEVTERVDVLPNGVDLSEFPDRSAILNARGDEVAVLRTRLRLGDGPVILFAGRISAEKSLHTLIEALPAVLRSVPEAKVLLCGQFAGLRSPLPTRERRELGGRLEWRARYTEYLQRLAAPYGDRVVFSGMLPATEIPLVFAMASVYVQPSILEAFGLPVTEAMCSEVPVVATRAGGIPEQVIDGETGYLVSVGDYRALGEAIARVLLDPELGRRLGQAGRARVERDFTWDQSAERLYEIWDALVDGSASAPSRPLAARA